MCTSHQITYTSSPKDHPNTWESYDGMTPITYQSQHLLGRYDWMSKGIYIQKETLSNLGVYNLYIVQAGFLVKMHTPALKTTAIFWRVHWAEKGGLLKGLFSSIMAMLGGPSHIFATLYRQKEIIRNPKLQLIQKPLSDTIHAL